ncbi:MAG: DUF6888 family protein [Xenococcaceae cyanobacterium]
MVIYLNLVCQLYFWLPTRSLLVYITFYRSGFHLNYATIKSFLKKDVNLLTNPQARKAVELCNFLSNAEYNIEVFRYDKSFKTIFILATRSQQELQLIIFETGEWEYAE